MFLLYIRVFVLYLGFLFFFLNTSLTPSMQAVLKIWQLGISGDKVISCGLRGVACLLVSVWIRMSSHVLRWSDWGLGPRWSQRNILAGGVNTILPATDRCIFAAWPQPPLWRSPMLCVFGTWKSKGFSNYLQGFGFLKLFLRLKMTFCSQSWVSARNNWKWLEEGG